MATVQSAWWTGMPWNDASGRFSALKAACLLLVCLPAAWMGNEVVSGAWDFPSPFIGLIYHSGLWATYLLLASLLVTPLRRILRWGRLVQFRRMLGVACFFYTGLHVVAWFGLRFWDWAVLANELAARLSLWVATLSLLILAALALTSFDGAIRAMGTRWKRLHRLAYAAAFLAVLHFLLSPGSLQGVPFLMAGFYAWAMGWRLIDKRGKGDDPMALALLGLGSALLVLVLQPVWLVTVQVGRTEQTPWQALADNINPDIWQYLGVPPVWIMLAWTIATVSISALRKAKALPKAIS